MDVIFGDELEAWATARGLEYTRLAPALLLAHVPSGDSFGAPSGYELQRYLDRFWLLLPAASGFRRQALVSGFFSWLAPDYEQSIDVERNLDNIRRLLDLASEFVGSLAGRHVLDFGCGPGLAREVAKQYDATITGFDLCPVMSASAISHGLVTIDIVELAMCTSMFEAVIASYVLHLLPGEEYLALAWQALRDNGVFCANFHKGRGTDAFRTFAREIGATVIEYENTIHGLYLVAVKGERAQ